MKPFKQVILVATLAVCSCSAAWGATVLSLGSGGGKAGGQGKVSTSLQTDQIIVAAQYEVLYQGGSLLGALATIAPGQSNHLATASSLSGGKSRVVLYS